MFFLIFRVRAESFCIEVVRVVRHVHVRDNWDGAISLVYFGRFMQRKTSTVCPGHRDYDCFGFGPWGADQDCQSVQNNEEPKRTPSERQDKKEKTMPVRRRLHTVRECGSCCKPTAQVFAIPNGPRICSPANKSISLWISI